MQSFEVFWKAYDKAIRRFECEHLWSRMTEEERKLTLIHVPKYVLSTPDKKFRKDPSTYLFNRGWEDEIIEKAPDPKATPAVYVKPEKPKVKTAWERYLEEKDEIERKKEEFYKDIKKAQQKEKPLLGLGDRLRQSFGIPEDPKNL